MQNLKVFVARRVQQLRSAFLPRVRAHQEGEALVLYRRWFGVDIKVSNKTYERYLPTFFPTADGLISRPAPAPPAVSLKRRARVTPRPQLGLGLSAGALPSLREVATGRAQHAAADSRADRVAQSAVIEGISGEAFAQQVYLHRMAQPSTFGDLPEVYALARSLNVRIHLYLPDESGDGLVRRLTVGDGERELALHLAGEHYQPFASVPQQHLLGAAETQQAVLLETRREGDCLFESVGLLVGASHEAMRAQAVGYLQEHATERPPFTFGEELMRFAIRTTGARTSSVD